MVSSGWQDSNLRPPHPKCGAIPGYATSRSGIAKVSFKIIAANLFSRSFTGYMHTCRVARYKQRRKN